MHILDLFEDYPTDILQYVYKDYTQAIIALFVMAKKKKKKAKTIDSLNVRNAIDQLKRMGKASNIFKKE